MSLQCAVRLVCAVYPLTQNYFAYLPLSAAFKKNGVEITRYNLTSAPMAFVNNKEVNRLITEKGVEVLPITVVDGAIVKTKAYPTNDEIISLLQVPRSYLGEQKTSAPKKNGGCNCKGGCC